MGNISKFRANHGLAGYDPDPVHQLAICPMLVTEQVRQCVVFIGIMEGGKFKPRATAFVVGCLQEGQAFLHLVTAEHVVSGLLSRGYQIWCRANTKDGGTVEFPFSADNWRFHPDESKRTDVAVCPFRPNYEYEGRQIQIEYRSVPIDGKDPRVATAELIAARKFGIGEEVCCVGLFRSHHGQQRNIPIVRLGSIAMMQHEPVYTDYAGYIDAYLIEMHSIGGLSGSPVFINVAPFRVVDGIGQPQLGPQNYLLGLVHGHFDIKNLNEDSVVENERDAMGSINTGVGVVIPVEKIIEAIQHPELIEMRHKVVVENRARAGAKADLGPEPDQSAPNGEESRHKERFTALLGAAAKTKKQGD